MILTTHAVLLEKNVFELIAGALGKKEKIIFSEDFDFVLPDGMEKMHWPSGTKIEVKYKLIYNSFERIVEQYHKVRPPKLVVVLNDKRGFREDMAKDLPIEVISFDDLRIKLDSLENSERNVITDKNYDFPLKRLKERIRDNTVSLFLGAGVSASAGIVTWDSLLEQLCIKKGLSKIDSDIDSIIKGRYIVSQYKKDGKILDDFYDDMKDILYPANVRPSKLIDSIANIAKEKNVESVISYNYDNLLEESLKNKGIRPYLSIYGNSRLSDLDSLPVYHVHGFIPISGSRSDIVLGEREYHKIYQDVYNWGNVEQLHALTRNTCIFIGLSMKDPNLRRLLDVSIRHESEQEPVHFAFLRKIEYDVSITEANMREFGVNCIWYNNHSELPEILDDLI